MEQRRDKLNPRISVTSTTGITEEYTVPVDSLITLKTGEPIKIGDPLFKIPSLVEKTRDITGGLPRVDELFEARRPKDAATLAEISGRIEDPNDIVKEKRILYIIPDSLEQEKVKVAIPVGKQIRVQHGDYVKQGDQIDDGKG